MHGSGRASQTCHSFSRQVGHHWDDGQPSAASHFPPIPELSFSELRYASTQRLSADPPLLLNTVRPASKRYRIPFRRWSVQGSITTSSLQEALRSQTSIDRIGQDSKNSKQNHSGSKDSNTSDEVDLRGEFDNLSPTMGIASSCLSRGALTRNLSGLPGQIVRSVGMVQIFLDASEVDDLVSRYQAGGTMSGLA